MTGCVEQGRREREINGHVRANGSEESEEEGERTSKREMQATLPIFLTVAISLCVMQI